MNAFHIKTGQLLKPNQNEKIQNAVKKRPSRTRAIQKHEAAVNPHKFAMQTYSTNSPLPRISTEKEKQSLFLPSPHT
jgi:hypothetical protein